MEEKNIVLKRELLFIEGMCGMLLRQANNIERELLKLKKYSIEDISHYSKLIESIDDKLFQTSKIIK